MAEGVFLTFSLAVHLLLASLPSVRFPSRPPSLDFFRSTSGESEDLVPPPLYFHPRHCHYQSQPFTYPPTSLQEEQASRDHHHSSHIRRIFQECNASFRPSSRSAG